MKYHWVRRTELACDGRDRLFIKRFAKRFRRNTITARTIVRGTISARYIAQNTITATSIQRHRL